MLDADDNVLTISRSHPINPTTTIQVSALTYTEPTSTDPLMATVFPKLAELMALDQSSSIAVTHRLNRETNAALQAEALARACQHEASSLFWDTDSQKFYLIHPTLSGNSPCTFLIETSREQITILSPHDAQASIITLCFKTLTLTLNTHLISHLPSLYILDTLLTTILILLLHIHRLSPSTSPLSRSSPTPSPSFPPPPSLNPPSPATTTPQTRRWTLPRFKRAKSKSTYAVSADLESASTRTPKKQKTHPPTGATYPISLPPPPSAALEIVDPKDESLPRTTRAILKLLYWAFSVVVWALGLAVQILAAVVVGLGKMTTKR